MNDIDDKKLEWINIASSISELNILPNNLTEIEVKGKKICIALYNKQLYACAAKCPHASGRMAEGFLDNAGNIICPLHRYKFKLSNGFNSSGEGYYLKTYPIKITEEGIFIGIKKSGWFSF